MVYAPNLSYAPSNYKSTCKQLPPASQNSPGAVYGDGHPGFLVTRNPTSRRFMRSSNWETLY